MTEQQLPTDDAMSSLTEMSEALYTAEQNVLELEARLKLAKRKRDLIAMKQVPEYMEAAGVAFLGMTGGRRVDVKPILSVTPLAANRPLVYAALDAQGAGNLIKTTVSIPFGRDSQAEVKKLVAQLQEMGHQTKCDVKVESSTLKKHVRTRLEQGLPVDTDLFGVKEFKKASFTEGAPKEPIFDGES